MRFRGASIGFFAVAVGLGGASAAAQNIVPDSAMAAPSGNTGAANNGIGHEGSLTGNAGSHASTVTGPAAAAQLAIHPAPPTSARNDPQLEKDPTQGGDTRH